MAFPMLTAQLKRGANPIAPPIALNSDGGVRYSIDKNLWIGNGFNNVKASSGVSTITFTGATLDPGKSVTIAIEELGGSIVIPLANNTAAALPLATLLVNEVNGAGGITVSGGALTGYSATAAGNVVTIKGKPGVKFTVTGSGFGTVGQPAAPTIAQTVAAICPGILPYGRAVVADPTVNARQQRAHSVIANEPTSTISLPTGSPTSVLVGVSVRDDFGVYDYSADCCGNESYSKEGYDCNDCAHYLKLMPGNPQQLKVTLEAPQSGDTMPVNILEAPISYREIGVASASEKGTFSVGAPAGDTNRKLCRNNASGAQLVIKSVIDAAKRQYFVGVAA